MRARQHGLHPQADLDRAWERAYPGHEAAERNATLRRLLGHAALRSDAVLVYEPGTNVAVEADQAASGFELQALEGLDQIGRGHIRIEFFGEGALAVDVVGTHWDLPGEL
jgi:hypothetical protein